MDTRLTLPPETLLDGRSYSILRVVGEGGFGVTYEARDVGLATRVAIKEYYPLDFGDRDNATMSVRPKSARHQVTFDWGRASFLAEARTLARFDHASIVRVKRVFEANSTAYMVMQFEEGKSLEAWLEDLGRVPTQAELDRIAAPLLDALEMMHAESFLHRDIAPDNIVVRPNGTPVLLDFGTARRAVAEMSRALTSIVKTGYSPPEQYGSDNRLQGPWSDIYALGGTLYRAVTGRAPEESTLRFFEDHLVSAGQAARGTYRPGFLRAIDVCLKIRQSERFQSVAEMRPVLLGTSEQLPPPPRVQQPPSHLADEAVDDSRPPANANPSAATVSEQRDTAHVPTGGRAVKRSGSGLSHTLMIGVLAAIVLLGGGAIWLWPIPSPDTASVPVPSPGPISAPPETPTSSAPPAQPTTPTTPAVTPPIPRLGAEWVSEFVRASEGPSPETLRPYFHDTVAPYYRMASADWASIEKEKATYFSRFSTIRYTVVGSPSITATDNGEKVEVDLAYRATQTNGDTLTGTTRWTMTVRYFDGAWKIAGIQERRVAP